MTDIQKERDKIRILEGLINTYGESETLGNALRYVRGGETESTPENPQGGDFSSCSKSVTK